MHNLRWDRVLLCGRWVIFREGFFTYKELTCTEFVFILDGSTFVGSFLNIISTKMRPSQTASQHSWKWNCPGNESKTEPQLTKTLHRISYENTLVRIFPLRLLLRLPTTPNQQSNNWPTNVCTKTIMNTVQTSGGGGGGGKNSTTFEVTASQWVVLGGFRGNCGDDSCERCAFY